VSNRNFCPHPGHRTFSPVVGTATCWPQRGQVTVRSDTGGLVSTTGSEGSAEPHSKPEHANRQGSSREPLSRQGALLGPPLGHWHAFCTAINCQARRERMLRPATHATTTVAPTSHRGRACAQRILFLLACIGNPRCTKACQCPSEAALGEDGLGGLAHRRAIAVAALLSNTRGSLGRTCDNHLRSGGTPITSPMAWRQCARRSAGRPHRPPERSSG